MILAWSLLLINLAEAPSPVLKPASAKRVTTAAAGIQRGALLDPFAERGSSKKRRTLPSSPEDNGLKDPFAAPPKHGRDVATRSAKSATAQGPLLDPFSIAPGVRAPALRLSDELKNPFNAPRPRPGKRQAASPLPVQVPIQRLSPPSAQVKAPPVQALSPSQVPIPQPRPPSAAQVRAQPVQSPSPAQVPIQRPRCRSVASSKSSPCPSPPKGAGPS